MTIPSVAQQAPVAHHAAVPAAAATSPPTAAPPASDTTPPGSPNPQLVLNPELGIVVLQFSDGDDGSHTTIPSQKQLNAYKDGSASVPGHAPPVEHKTA